MTKPKLTDVAYTIAWVLIAAVVIGGAYYQGRQDGWKHAYPVDTHRS